MKTSIKHYSVIILLLCFVNLGFSQIETAKWKALIALGVNSPSQGGFVDGFAGKSVNFPTINLGIQRMFTEQYGAKIDLGYNRFSGNNNFFANKINYTRINAQFVYDATPIATFLPVMMGLVGHIGPGYSIIKPLGDFKENKTSFLNAMAGVEAHYRIARTVSAFADVSYIYGFGGSFNPVTEGIGSFNGNLLTVTVGVSISLSGCVTCN
ncbi:cell envelope biogenesis protein OmpA [uncultured Lacinutrix sp.]|uniref:cell envelope biogenesis protein OmpA n=1 Tax=uncultured Lacinutrix sp. TaxID=574032 RepID=UPI00260F6AED|nr:cell envelope biogenesis protein OmpA [uncultured Lacinutrix sp.]